MIHRGLLPFLATPGAGETLLEDAVRHAARLGLVAPHDHVVVVGAARALPAALGCYCSCSTLLQPRGTGHGLWC